MKPISLNVSELQESVKSRVGQLGDLSKIDENVSFFPNPGIIGFVIRDPDFGRLDPGSLKDLKDMSAELAGGLGKPVTILQDDGILIGFFPQNTLKF